MLSNPNSAASCVNGYGAYESVSSVEAECMQGIRCASGQRWVVPAVVLESGQLKPVELQLEWRLCCGA